MKITIFHFVIFCVLITRSNVVSARDILQYSSRQSQDGQPLYDGVLFNAYAVEEHIVITDDGYKLSLFHVSGDKNRPVLLVHGNTAAADTWFMRRETSLALTLAEQGYDVWAINMRGSVYSRKHESISPTFQSHRFFNYSFYEQGIYDIPATIDYILEKTEQKQLLAIGHSVGTTVFYVMGSERPEYNEKVKALISLAPICFLDHIKGIARIAVSVGPFLNLLLTLFGVTEVAGRNQSSSVSFRSACSEPNTYDICVKKIIFGLFGPDEEGFEPEFQPTFFAYFPAGSSRKLFNHLIQVRDRKQFAKYDYGSVRNLRIYNCTEPPQFDLSKVTMKVALLVGNADYLSTPEDVERLSSMLPNVVHHQVLPYENFTHGNFVWGKHMTDRLYPYLFELIEQYSGLVP